MLTDILSPDRVFTDLRSMPKVELLREMTRRLAALGELKDPEACAHLLIKREELITTGVKRGFAFPHAFSPQLDRLILTVGVVAQGTDYEALDGHPVEYVILLLGPPAHQDDHLRVLARLSRITTQPEMLDALREAAGPEAIVEMLLEADRRAARN
jgi:mannitol/fructose-specific phosphotransferase system IIA component (Ntr-type)